MKKQTSSLTFLFLTAVLSLTGCHSIRRHQSWQQAMANKISRYENISRLVLIPYLKHANLSYPPQQLALIIIKKNELLELWGKGHKGSNNTNSRWRYIRSYPVLAASGKLGPKLHSGDRQVPEGIYHIIGMNPESQFDLSLHLNYPNDMDKKFAKLDGRDHLGGDIYIHGNKLSIGCVPIGNRAIEQLFPLIYRVGIVNVEVIITPVDLRLYPNPKLASPPKWLPELYGTIRKALLQFPIHKI